MPAFNNNNGNLNNVKDNVVVNHPINKTKMNEMNIQYLIDKTDERINLFGEEFVKNFLQGNFFARRDPCIFE